MDELKRVAKEAWIECYFQQSSELTYEERPSFEQTCAERAFERWWSKNMVEDDQCRA